MNMYAEIIARAEARRANLEKFQTSLKHLPGLLGQIKEAQGQIKDTLAAWNALDLEGKQLIGACYPDVDLRVAAFVLDLMVEGPRLSTEQRLQLSRLCDQLEYEEEA